MSGAPVMRDTSEELVFAPNPARSGAHEAIRDLDCAHYGDCLDRAVREGWPGFTCRECALRGRAGTGYLRVESWLGNPEGGRAAPPIPPSRAPRGPIMPKPHVRGGFYLEVFARFSERPEWSIAELAEAMRQPATRIRDAIDHCMNRGLVQRVAWASRGTGGKAIYRKVQEGA